MGMNKIKNESGGGADAERIIAPVVLQQERGRFKKQAGVLKGEREGLYPDGNHGTVILPCSQITFYLTSLATAVTSPEKDEFLRRSLYMATLASRASRIRGLSFPDRNPIPVSVPVA
jgi:hypothetical protein